MPENKSYFPDSESYDRAMGRWSRRVGAKFLDWLDLPPGLRWIDVGCGTGSFTELVLMRNQPGAISAIDPSGDQIAFARQRRRAAGVDYRQEDAMAMPYADDEFDVAAMALAIQYVPDPPKAMSEVRRVVKPGGTVAAYVWDTPAGGNPGHPVNEALKSIGFAGMRRPPSGDLQSMDALADLFAGSGLQDIARRTIRIRLDFQSLDEYWEAQVTHALKRVAETLTEADIGRLRSALRECLLTGQGDRISYMAKANAVKGIVPT